MVDPERNMMKVYNIIGDILKRFKQLKVDQKTNDAVVVRNLAFGIPAGTDDFLSYSKWKNFDQD